MHITNMNYEKAYKEALNWMRSIYPTLTGSDKEDAEHYFPELAESEDERIRKALIGLVYSDVNELINGVEKRLCISWLEKQKEHQNNSDAPNESSWTGIISSSDKDSNLDELAQEYIDGVKQYNPTPTWDLMQTAVCYGYHYCEQKDINNE